MERLVSRWFQLSEPVRVALLFALDVIIFIIAAAVDYSERYCN